MPTVHFIRSLLEQATARGTKATVLKPLGWLLGILITAIFISFYIHAPIWVPVMFSVFVGLVMSLYLGAFIYCLLKDRDALRSETYSIQKLAIEKGFVGDDIAGILQPLADRRAALIAANATDESEVPE